MIYKVIEIIEISHILKYKSQLIFLINVPLYHYLIEIYVVNSFNKIYCVANFLCTAIALRWF